MLLGILFFLSTSFNPVYQDKRFTKENFVSKIKADVETYNINNNFLRDISPIWQTKLSLNDKNKLIEILNNITKNKNHLDNSIYFSFLNYIVLLHDSGITLLSNFSQIIGHHENQAKFKNISILDEINYVSNILKEKWFLSFCLFFLWELYSKIPSTLFDISDIRIELDDEIETLFWSK